MRFAASSMVAVAGLAIACSGTGSKNATGPPISDVTVEQLEKDAMEPADPNARLDAWRKYDGKVVRWTGTPVEPNKTEERQATSNYDLKDAGRRLLVVKVGSVRCQIPAPVAFKPGATVTFTGKLNGTYVDSAAGANLRLVMISAEGLELR